jgi:hypothetical protein
VRRRHDLIAVPGPRVPAAVTGAGGPVAGDASGTVAPEAFRWRGRRYVVTEVLAHWVEAAAWWRAGGASPSVAVTAGQQSAEQPAQQPARPSAQQRRWWRVAARPTHPATQGAPGVYELCCSGGTWSLRRVHD